MSEKYDAIVIGSGIGGLTAASLLARDGLKVAVFEQNYLPGGCTSSYWRKGFVFEAGATTLVGLDENMPLSYVLDRTGIQLKTIPLELPMVVHLKDGRKIKKYQELSQWIAEAERVFGPKGQKKFWKFCFEVSKMVWQTSLKQKLFPPTSFSDWVQCIRKVDWQQLEFAPYAFYSMRWLLRKYGLLEQADFVDFVNQQLMITAQNRMEEVNVLFGATALCYTNFGNYYMPGGLLQLVQPFVEYIKSQQGKVFLRNGVRKVEKMKNDYLVETNQGSFSSKFLISAIPFNDTRQLFDNLETKQLKKKEMQSAQLHSAFQMGIAFRLHQKNDALESIHHQIHLKQALPEIGSHSIFISFNHPKDTQRSDLPGHRVASVSTHIPDPEKKQISDKKAIEEVILDVLTEKGFFQKEDIVYTHSSTQKSWQKWTGRSFGFVGGYPQYLHIKPWQMNDARLDRDKAYICGDTTYPGQGIPGATLSGIIAYQKMKSDWKL